MEDVTAIAEADGMTGVMTALIAGDAVVALRKDIDNLSFSFVAPLKANDCEVLFHLKMFIECFRDDALVYGADDLLFNLAVLEDE
jgi:hypothetical protein